MDRADKVHGKALEHTGGEAAAMRVATSREIGK
jgi:hypothetical protein